MIFLRQAKIPGHLEDHIMAKTNGSRNFSGLLDAIQILARRPMSQISSSFPSYYDEWDESTSATEYYDINDHDDVDNDEYYDEYNEPEDHDNEWIDMSGILEDATFEEPRVGLYAGESPEGQKRDRARVSGEARKVVARVSPRDVLKAGKGGRPENYKTSSMEVAERIDLTGAGKTSQLMERIKDVVVYSWLRWMISSLAPGVSNVEELGHLAKECPQNKETTTHSETFFSGMVYVNSCNVHPRNRFCADRWP